MQPPCPRPGLAEGDWPWLAAFSRALMQHLLQMQRQRLGGDSVPPAKAAAPNSLVPSQRAITCRSRVSRPLLVRPPRRLTASLYSLLSAARA